MMLARKIAWAVVVLLVFLSITGCCYPSSLSAPVTSRDDVIARVIALPDAAAWIKLVHTESPANRIVIDVDSEDSTTYTVRAYEFVLDEFGGHSATFGWYEVTGATGDVRSVMP